MRFANAIAVLVLALPVAVWILGREGGFQPGAQSPSLKDVFSAGLGIDTVEKKPAPDFFLKDLDGNIVRLQDLKGKVVLLNFWATWCPTCRFEMPLMEALHKELSSQGLAVLAIAFRESAEEVRTFYNEHRLSFPALLDHDAKAAELYDVWSLPTSFVIDKHGYVVGKIIGYRDWNSDPSKDYFLHLLKDST
ncbi:MAG TPA: TlpA disulfide reductase family protein [Candidatus Binatia bacterium]|nr:TlpA disulfide reductase family protein [Candidatus Binatia bacterium]